MKTFENRAAGEIRNSKSEIRNKFEKIEFRKGVESTTCGFPFFQSLGIVSDFEIRISIFQRAGEFRGLQFRDQSKPAQPSL
jgi:hypothetical protein